MNKKMRNALKIRARFHCEYCLSQEYFSPDPFEGDHIIATSQGGSDTLDNLALACSGCNGYKSGAISAIDFGTGQRVPLYNPRTDIWKDHFRWNENIRIAFCFIKFFNPINTHFWVFSPSSLLRIGEANKVKTEVFHADLVFFKVYALFYSKILRGSFLTFKITNLPLTTHQSFVYLC